MVLLSDTCLFWTNTIACMQHVGLGGMYPEFYDFLLVKVMKDTILYQFQDNNKIICRRSNT